MITQIQSKVIKISPKEFKLVVRGLPSGFGKTLGLVVRRGLFNMLEGAKIAKIASPKHIHHPFAHPDWAIETVTTIKANLSKVFFDPKSFEGNEKVIAVKTKKKGEIVAECLGVDGLVVLNPEAILFNKSTSEEVELTLTIKKGFSCEFFRKSDEQKAPQEEIFMDMSFGITCRCTYYSLDRPIELDQTRSDTLVLVFETEYECGSGKSILTEVLSNSLKTLQSSLQSVIDISEEYSDDKELTESERNITAGFEINEDVLEKK